MGASALRRHDMKEQISLNGAPVVGFGITPEDVEQSRLRDLQDPYKMALARERATAPATIIGFFVGSIGGAVLGNFVHKGAVGTAIGTMSGGFGGAVGGNLLAMYATREPLPTPWQRVPEKSVSAGDGGLRQILDVPSLKAGDQCAFAVAAPGGVLIPPDQIAQVTQLFQNLPTGYSEVYLYPPGAKLPANWPTDDDLGPNAYRVMENVLADVAQGAAALGVPPTSVGTIKMWVRSKR